MKKVFRYPLIVFLVYVILFIGLFLPILIDPTSALGWIWVIVTWLIIFIGWIPLIIAAVIGHSIDKKK
jgi:threonine/homoserine/homoserine lactone efflux protein